MTFVAFVRVEISFLVVFKLTLFSAFRLQVIMSADRFSAHREGVAKTKIVPKPWSTDVSNALSELDAETALLTNSRRWESLCDVAIPPPPYVHLCVPPHWLFVFSEMRWVCPETFDLVRTVGTEFFDPHLGWNYPGRAIFYFFSSRTSVDVPKIGIVYSSPHIWRGFEVKLFAILFNVAYDRNNALQLLPSRKPSEKVMNYVANLREFATQMIFGGSLFRAQEELQACLTMLSKRRKLREVDVSGNVAFSNAF